MADPIIIAENLGKKYQVRHLDKPVHKYSRLSEELLAIPGKFFRKYVLPGSLPADNEEFWALRNVAFEVFEGEVLGIIGRNGAGKSTLLKILSRITEPSEGRVKINQRIASLLEVGTGFHPELTGRENIYLNGAILGMSRAEISKKFDEIVAFAEVERFIDTPVKRYSSGMHVRLAFAVASYLEPEILIIDEVLAVGDSRFQKKCLGKMQEIGTSGRTVILVSHNMAIIQNLCNRSIFLSNGRINMQGNTDAVIKCYQNEIFESSSTLLKNRTDRKGSGDIRFETVTFCDASGNNIGAAICGNPVTIKLKFNNHLHSDLKNLHVSIGINNEYGQRILLLDSSIAQGDFEFVPVSVNEVIIYISKIPLVPGRYTLTLYSMINDVISDWIRDACSFIVESGDYFGTGRLPASGQSLFFVDHSFEIRESSIIK